MVERRKNQLLLYKNTFGLDSIIVTFWAGDWINSLRENIINDSQNNQIEQVDQTWVGYEWKNYERRFLTYNSYNLNTSVSCELWNNNQWGSGDGQILINLPENSVQGFVAYTAEIFYSDITELRNNKAATSKNFYLSQNYPNPFNPSTTINYTIPKSGFVTIKVYNILGKEIAELVNEEKPTGNYQVQFNANGLASGVYIYRIRADEYSKSKLMILEK